MNKILILLSITLSSCAHFKNESPTIMDDQVTVRTALDQAQASYALGCVQAYQTLKLGPSFEHCVERSRDHRFELEMIMNQEPIDKNLPDQ